jgi:hypothetical protein
MSEEGESQSTTTTKPKPPYRGITFHAGKWLVKLRHRGKDVTIAHMEHPEDAAWVADYARYILRGLNPACWGPKTMKPNFPPRESEYVNGWAINWRLIGAGAISLVSVAEGCQFVGWDEVRVPPTGIQPRFWWDSYLVPPYPCFRNRNSLELARDRAREYYAAARANREGSAG